MTDTNQARPWYRRGPHHDALPRRPVPEPNYLVGSDRVPVRVFLRRSAWDEIEAFAAGPDNDERGGLLVGHPYADDSGPYIIIEGAVPAHAVLSDPGGLTFTQQAWDDMESRVNERFPTEFVVGWFHTRPDAGTSLTGFDRFTAHRYFPEWWQLTYIIDPVRQRQRIYMWHEGELRSLPGFWVCESDEDASTGGLASAAVAAAASEAMAADATETRRTSTIALAFVGVLLLLAALVPWPGSLLSLNRVLQQQAADTQLLVGELERLRDHHRMLQQAVAILEEETDPSDEASLPDGSVGQVDALGEDGVEEIAETAPVMETSPPDSDIFSSGPNVLSTSGYVVRTGDTLWDISERLLGDPYAYIRVALQNELDDPNLILPGWELKLPASAGDADTD